MSFNPMEPFRRGEALAAGLTDQDLRGPHYRKLLWGVHISSSVAVSPFHLPAAALLIHPPGAVITHCSAARLLGAPVPKDPRVHVSVSDVEDRRQRQGVRCHIAAIDESEVVVQRKLRMSAPHRMFVELASELSLVELVVVGDWLVRQAHVTCTSLVDYCAGSQMQHAKQAWLAATYVRERVDSPMETRLRLLIVLAGLPEPEVNLKIRDSEGVVVLRLDLSYPRVKLAIEYDGRHHVERAGQWEQDVERRDDLPEDWRLLTVTSRGIYLEPAKTLDRIWRALASRGWRPLSPPTSAWRPHFN